jgi:hypothetical protein
MIEKTLLATLRQRYEEGVRAGKFTEYGACAHVHLTPYRVGEDDEILHMRTLTDIGDDYIQVEDRDLIDRRRILGITPINF